MPTIKHPKKEALGQRKYHSFPKIQYDKICEIIDALNNGGLDYKVYSALLTQSGTDAPVATVLGNSLDNAPTLVYVSPGVYNIVLTGAFAQDKTFMLLGSAANFPFDGTKGPASMIYWVDNSTLQILTGDGVGFANGQLSYTPIEIRVYN